MTRSRRSPSCPIAARRLGVPSTDAHNALQDVQTTLAVLPALSLEAPRVNATGWPARPAVQGRPPRTRWPTYVGQALR